MIGSRTRLSTASSAFIEKKAKNYVPKSKLFMPIKLNENYMKIQETADVKNGRNLDELVTSFFSFDIQKKTPSFTPEEWVDILQENDVNVLKKDDVKLKRLYSSLNHGLPVRM